MVSELQYPTLAERAKDIADRLDVSGMVDKLNEDRERGNDPLETISRNRRENRVRTSIMYMPLFVGSIADLLPVDLVSDRRPCSPVQINATITNWYEGAYCSPFGNVSVSIPIETLCFCPPCPNTARSKWYYSSRSPHLKRERLRIAAILYHEFIHCYQAATGMPMVGTGAQHVMDDVFFSPYGYTRKMYLDELLAEVLHKGNYDSLRKIPITTEPVAAIETVPTIPHSHNGYAILVPEYLLVQAASLLEPEKYIKGAFIYALEAVKDRRVAQLPVIGRFLTERTAKEREAAVIRENFDLLGAYNYFMENTHGIEHSLSPAESRTLVWQKMGVAL